ncbi:GntR family transcriptional regulator [Paraburkholderia xenovorans]|uniref:GntR family transcriptional regulator n=1 Tax=Paraburkholderia xenovorans TaxID=36873 RepID=UPI0038B89E85
MNTTLDVPAALSKSAHMFDQVHDHLWELIIKGDIKPGDRLKDTEWAGKLGLSRTPVREAMRKLQQEGVLLPLSAGGYQVKSVSNKDLEELYTCRAALEKLATMEASRRIDKQQCQALMQTVELADKAILKKQFDTAFRLNSDFHKAVFEIADNSHLAFLLESISKLVLFYRSALLNRVKSTPELAEAYIARLTAKQEAHRAIVRAMASGEHDEAGELMHAHVLASIKELAT